MNPGREQGEHRVRLLRSRPLDGGRRHLPARVASLRPDLRLRGNRDGRHALGARPTYPSPSWEVVSGNLGRGSGSRASECWPMRRLPRSGFASSPRPRPVPEVSRPGSALRPRQDTPEAHSEAATEDSSGRARRAQETWPAATYGSEQRIPQRSLREARPALALARMPVRESDSSPADQDAPGRHRRPGERAEGDEERLTARESDPTLGSRRGSSAAPSPSGGLSHRGGPFSGGVAAWSSLVARGAHNPEVVGSNPTVAISLTLAGVSPKLGPAPVFFMSHPGRRARCVASS